MSFDNKMHSIAQSDDGSFTAYSFEYNEHYHSTKDGALNESLQKHIIPGFRHVKKRQEVHILDICYGLGFNTLATILYYKKHRPQQKLFIYSPELDKKLIASLPFFSYPDSFSELEEIILALSSQGVYEENGLYIELFLGDAREYVKRFTNHFDVVYQDAFSPNTNPVLWTKEYFFDIKTAMKADGLLTTYSTALKTRLALYNNGFFVYLHKGEGFRNATLASLEELAEYERVDMKHKIACNPTVSPLSDSDLAINYS